MIGKLKGVVDELGEDHVLIDCGGVCYIAFCSSRSLIQLEKGRACALFIETFVREDQLKLYGFLSPLERDWFRLLQMVQGVGAKVALAVLSTLSVGELSDAITLQDQTTIARTPGIGPKVATRIVTELKSKVPAGDFVDKTVLSDTRNAASRAGASSVSDAISALSNLGYSHDQAARVVALVVQNGADKADSATLIRLGLKQLAQS